MSALDLSLSRFILPADAELRPVRDLSPGLRAKLGPVDDTAIVITRPGFRATTRLVPAPMATLLEEFRVESLVTDAVLRFSTTHGQDPLEILDMVFQALSTLIEARILLVASEPDAQVLTPSLAPGQDFDGFRIDRLVRSLNDSEVFQGRTESGVKVALKLARDARAAPALHHEADILTRLGGKVGPRLVAQGTSDGRTWLALEWRNGVLISVAAQAARASGDKKRLHRLISRMLDAYAALHACGVAHGDIHPGNVLADANDQITILDFGQAKLLAEVQQTDPARTGIPQFHDPAMARAILDGRLPPGANAMDEQFALSTLAYLLIAGVHPVRLVADRTQLLTRIVAQSPLPFAAQEVDSWPDVEAVLRRGMAKESADRYPDTSAFAHAFRATGVPKQTVPDGAVENVTGALRAGTKLSDAAPHVMAWLCLRAALVCSDSDLLALASIWSLRATPGWEAASVAAQVARARSDWSDHRAAITSLTAELHAVSTWEPRMLMHIAQILQSQVADQVFDADPLLAFSKDCLRSPAATDDCDGDILHAMLALHQSGAIPTPINLPDRLAQTKHGSVWLWSLAYDVFQDPRYQERALSAALPSDPIGHGFACLRLHQLTGELHWVDAARQDCKIAVMSPLSMLLLIECQSPSRAIPPLLTGFLGSLRSTAL